MLVDRTMGDSWCRVYRCHEGRVKSKGISDSSHASDLTSCYDPALPHTATVITSVLLTYRVTSLIIEGKGSA